jgi:hypothetical protein
MAVPKNKPETLQTDDETTISPNGDTTAERYAQAKELDDKLSMEERVKRIREAPSIFDFEPKAKKDKKDS